MMRACVAIKHQQLVKLGTSTTETRPAASRAADRDGGGSFIYVVSRLPRGFQNIQLSGLPYTDHLVRWHAEKFWHVKRWCCDL